MENLSVHEIDIRKSLNEETQKRKELEAKQEAIDKEIAALEARKEQISAEFEESKTQTGELDNQLGEVMETKEKCTTDIETMEQELADLTSDDQMNSDREQHQQFVSWKESVEKVMNEIQKARELEWMKWTPQEIIDWICRLDQGTFRVYREKLAEEIPSKLDNGEDLLFLLQDRQTIRELGVTKIRHRDMLINHIERLNRNNPSKNHAAEKGENPNV